MSQKKITMYFRPMCGFCAAAERLLKSKGYQFEKIDIWAVPGAKEEMVARQGAAAACRKFSLAMPILA